MTKPIQITEKEIRISQKYDEVIGQLKLINTALDNIVFSNSELPKTEFGSELNKALGNEILRLEARYKSLWENMKHITTNNPYN